MPTQLITNHNGPQSVIRPPVTGEAMAGTFGRRLRIARNRRGLTQEDLAARAAISVSQIYRLEIGDREPRLSTVMRLAHALDMEGSELIRGIG